MSEELFNKLMQAVVDGEPEDAESLAKQALDQKVDPLECINMGLMPGIQKVGELFSTGEYYLPELIIGADAMTVEGDLHEIGKTLVGTMLTANGFKVTDLGVDQKPEAFVAAVEEHNADIVGASALLTTTMLQQKKLIEALETSGLRDKVKVMVGGAPVTDKYAAEIGADGYAEDAISAVDVAYRLMDAPV